MVRCAAHNSVFIEERFLHLGMRCGKAIDLLPAQSIRIQLVAGRHRLFAQEWEVVIQEIPPVAHHAEEFGKHRALCHAIHCPSTQIALLPVQLVHQPAGIGKLRDHLPLARAEPCTLVRDNNPPPASGAVRFVVRWASAGIASRGNLT